MTLKQVIKDIETLRKKGIFPWPGASGRRAMERRYTYTYKGIHQGKSIIVDLATSASCKYTRHSVQVYIDDIQLSRYMPTLKTLV